MSALSATERSKVRIRIRINPCSPNMQIEGKITYEDLEGGFWGIIDSRGNKFVPIEGLPDHMRVDGKHIRADLEPVHMIGTTMWGEYVKVTSITAVD